MENWTNGAMSESAAGEMMGVEKQEGAQWNLAF
jgi:hypothetical protein